MIIEKEIETKHETDVVLKILSDSSFILPLVFPIKMLMEKANGVIYAKGDVRGLPVIINIREYIGSSITYVLDFEKPKLVGKMSIYKLDENRIRIVIEIDTSLIYWPLKISIERKLNKLQSNFDELIRLERIKRKI
ncbi:MAG: DUF3211 family protein [Saccharolobus sp.]